MWWMYVVECSDGTLYTGVTKDIDRRVHEHNNTKRGAKYTRSRRPVTVVYRKPYSDWSEVLREEYKFKNLTRREKLRIIEEQTKQRSE